MTSYIDPDQYIYALNDYENHYTKEAELSNATKEELHSLYGCPGQILPHDGIVRPPSPSESLEQIKMYKMKQVNKGFCSNSGGIIDRRNRFTNKATENEKESKNKDRYMQQEKFDHEEIKELFKKEPYMEFWLTTNVVKASIRDIKSLPFEESRENDLCIGKFYDRVTTIIRKIVANAPHKKSKTYLKEEMMQFLIEVHSLRDKIIENAIKSQKLILKKITFEIRKKYSKVFEEIEIKPEKKENNSFMQSAKIETDAELKFIDHARVTADKFPNQYEVDASLFKSDNLARLQKDICERTKNIMQAGTCTFTQAKSHPVFIATPCIPAPITKPKRSVVIKSYSLLPPLRSLPSSSPQEQKHTNPDVSWFESDPLCGLRQGEAKSAYSQFQEIISLPEIEPMPLSSIKVDFPHLKVDDYVPPPVAVVEGGPELISGAWYTGDIFPGLCSVILQHGIIRGL